MATAADGSIIFDPAYFAIGDDDEEQLRKLQIEKYFTSAELTKMGEYERMRMRKIKQVSGLEL